MEYLVILTILANFLLISKAGLVDFCGFDYGAIHRGTVSFGETSCTLIMISMFAGIFWDIQCKYYNDINVYDTIFLEFNLVFGNSCIISTSITNI